MKIRKVEIENFGCLKDVTVKFSDGLQILYGKNEAGKSTFMEFIKIMLYADMGRGVNSIIRGDRSPWDGSKMGGAIEFEKEKRLYRLQKELDAKTPSKDKCFLKCISNNEVITLGKKEEIGEKFLKITLEDFERSGYINSLGDESFKSGKSIEDMMLNLINTGDENISKKLSEERLDEAIRQLKWKNNSKRGRLNELNQEISDIRNSLYDINEKQQQGSKINEEIAKMEKLRKEREDLKKCVEKFRLSLSLKNLKNLEKHLKKKEELKNKVEESGIPYCEFRETLSGLISNKEKIERLGSEIKNLKKESEKITYVDEIYLNEIKELLDKKAKFKDELDDIDETLLQEAEQIKTKYKQVQEKKLESEKLKEEVIESNEKCVEKVAQEIEKLNLSKENDILSMEYEKAKKIISKNSKDLSNAGEKYKLIRKSIFFIELLIIISITFFLIYIGKFNLTSCFLTFILGLVPFSINKINLILQKNVLKKEFKKSIENFINILEKGINIEEEFLRQIFNNIIEKKEKWNKLSQNMGYEKIKLQIVLDDKIEICLKKIKNDIECEMDKIDNKIDLNLKSKNLPSYEEAEKIYNGRLALEGIISRNEKSMFELKKGLFKAISQYSKDINSYDDAINYLNKLNIISDEQIENNQNIDILKQSLSIDKEDLKLIENLIIKKKTDLENITEENLADTFDIDKCTKLEERLKELEKLNLNDKINNLKRETADYYKEQSDLKEKLSNLEDEFEQKNSYLESLKLAKSMLDKSYDELKSEIIPKINEKTSSILSNLTLDKYNTVSVHGNCDVLVRTGSFDRKHTLFSSGTIDQAYLSLRLALSEVISNNNSIPIMLDDVLVRYDDERTKTAIKYLKKYASEKGLQIIIFTCHNYISQIGNKYSVKSTNLFE